MLDYENGNEPVEHDYTHPERHFKRVTLRRKGGFPEDFKRDGWLSMTASQHDPQIELCSACGWTTYEQTCSGYGPRIRIMHARGNSGLWSIGHKWLIRDQPNNITLGNDYMTYKFLREQPGLTIPLVKEMRLLSEPEDPIHFTLISRAQGKMLNSIWGTLSPEQKASYRDQMVDILKQLRQFTAPFPQKVNGDQLDDALLTICYSRHPPTCMKIGFTAEEWLENLSETLRGGLSQIHNTKDPKVIEEKLQEIKDNFPSGEPYVLTHGDLNLTNIIVKDDKIEAIIDWEMSGYMPWWGETFLTTFYGYDNEDDLFEGIWDRVHPDLGKDNFYVLIQKLKPLRAAFARCYKKHVDPLPGFWRPPFANAGLTVARSGLKTLELSLSIRCLTGQRTKYPKGITRIVRC